MTPNMFSCRVVQETRSRELANEIKDVNTTPNFAFFDYSQVKRINSFPCFSIEENPC